MALGFSSYIFLIECTGLAQGRFPTLCVLLGRKGVVQTIPSCRDDFRIDCREYSSRFSKRQPYTAHLGRAVN